MAGRAPAIAPSPGAGAANRQIGRDEILPSLDAVPAAAARHRRARRDDRAAAGVLALFQLHALPVDPPRDAVRLDRLAQLRQRIHRFRLLDRLRPHRAAADGGAQSGDVPRPRPRLAGREGHARAAFDPYADDVPDDVLADPRRLPVQIPVQRQCRLREQRAAIARDHPDRDSLADRRQPRFFRHRGRRGLVVDAGVRDPDSGGIAGHAEGADRGGGGRWLHALAELPLRDLALRDALRLYRDDDPLARCRARL